ncbi:hypothetical protein ACFFX0_16725 [Citricoccus parietis]|uniref:Uncharacterized protein n=1 Tax=Citricoccus parietis TaxID=592307 RepID=A0ABV5G1H0_9MICC
MNCSVPPAGTGWVSSHSECTLFASLLRCSVRYGDESGWSRTAGATVPA